MLVEIFLELSLGEMSAQRLKACVVQHAFQVSRLLIVKIERPAQLNHRVPNFPYALEGSLDVFLEVIANRVELQPDRHAVRVRGDTPVLQEGEGAEPPARPLQKLPAANTHPARLSPPPD